MERKATIQHLKENGKKKLGDRRTKRGESAERKQRDELLMKWVGHASTLNLKCHKGKRERGRRRGG